MVLVDAADVLNLREWAGVGGLANFVWVAVHDPGDNPEWEGLDWSTWFVFMELDGTLPKVVGLQIQTWGP